MQMPNGIWDTSYFIRESNGFWVPARQHHKDVISSFFYAPVNECGNRGIYACAEHEDGGIFEVHFTNRTPSFCNKYVDARGNGEETQIMLCSPLYAEFENSRIAQNIPPSYSEFR